VARRPATAEPTAEPPASAVVTQVSDSAPLPGTITSSVSNSATVAGPNASATAVRQLAQQAYAYAAKSLS